MKKAIRLSAFILSIAIIISAFAAVPVSAAGTLKSGPYTYSVTNGEATITNVEKSISGDITIPSSLDGYPVTGIGDSAFIHCRNLKSAIIGNNITNIENWTFADCSSLISVTIGNSVTSIGKRAFASCSSLTNINIPNNVKSIGERAFSLCGGLKSITIPESVTSIGSYAFSYCSSLTSIDIPNSITSIDSHTFSDCSSLININIPNSVTSIGDSAFASCSSLTSINIPNSVTSIGGYAFIHCRNLKSAIIGNNVADIEDWTFTDCSSLTSVTIGNSVTSIGKRAFASCSSLTNINIPNNVKSIGERAFSLCSSLKSIIIPESVTSISGYAFLYHSDDLVIKCAPGSYAAEYAKNNGIKVQYGTASSSDTMNVSPGRYGIIVRNSSGNPVIGAKITYNDCTEYTDILGHADFPITTVGEPKITVSKSGFITYTNSDINYEKSDNGYEIITLISNIESSLKLNYAYYHNNYSADVLSGTKVVALPNKKTLNFSNDKFDLYCSAADPEQVLSYEIYQNGKSIYMSKNGYFTDLSPRYFSEGGGVSVRVMGKNYTYVTTPINLQFAEESSGGSENISLKITDKVSFKVGKNIPFLGGT